MILGMLSLLWSNPFLFLLVLSGVSIALLVAISVHESSHALMAYHLGDPTAKRAGRLSLNPLAHLDPLGTILLFLVGFGWGKPVPVDPYYLRNGVKKGMAMVALAGPLSNLVAATLISLPIKLGLLAWHSPFSYRPFAQFSPAWILADIAGYVIFYNLILALFNLIPIAPLDGFRIAVGVLPTDLSIPFSRMEQYGPMLLLLLLGFDYFTRAGLLWAALRPAANLFSLVLVGRQLL